MISTYQHTARARCALCGQWAKADRLVDLVLVSCSGILCPSHARGIVGKGQTDRQAFADFLDGVENAKNS